MENRKKEETIAPKYNKKKKTNSLSFFFFLIGANRLVAKTFTDSEKKTHAHTPYSKTNTFSLLCSAFKHRQILLVMCEIRDVTAAVCIYLHLGRTRTTII